VTNYKQNHIEDIIVMMMMMMVVMMMMMIIIIIIIIIVEFRALRFSRLPTSNHLTLLYRSNRSLCVN